MHLPPFANDILQPTPDLDDGTGNQSDHLQPNSVVRPCQNVARSTAEESNTGSGNLDNQFSAADEPISDALSTTSAKLKDTYHLAFETVMREYQPPAGVEIDARKITRAIQAGCDCIMENPHDFISTKLSTWLTTGLWPPVPVDDDSRETTPDCFLDMMYVGIEREPERTRLLRRLARVRLLYWYETYKKEHKHDAETHSPGVDVRTTSIDYLLQGFYLDWDTASDQDKQSRRRRFHMEKTIGKKWCQLVQHFGPGILVISGKGMDTQMLLSHLLCH